MRPCCFLIPIVAAFLFHTSLFASTRAITIGSTHYATYCDSVALDFRQSPVRAYGLRLEDGHLLRTPMPITPARVGMLLHADKPGTYEIPIYSPSESSTLNSHCNATLPKGEPSTPNPQFSTLHSPSEAPGNELVGVLQDTQVPWVSEDDSAHNYILQPEGWRRASGGILRGGKAFLHTDAEVGETIDARLDQLIDQELDSFQLNDGSSFFRLPSYIYFLLGVGIYFLCWFLWRRRRNKS